MLALAGVWAGQRAFSARPASDRGLVALMLYGEPDPQRIVAAGLHGLGGRPARIGLTQGGPCRFTLTTEQQGETIDFDQVSTIRFAEVADPASGLLDMAGGPRGGAARRLTLVILEGTGSAICRGAVCASRSAFALPRPERLDAARSAARTFLSRTCPPKTTDQPPGPH